MQTIFKLLFLALLIPVFGGCSAQRSAIKGAESEILHAQAVKALDAGSFVIRAEEFYFLDGKPVKSSPDSSISMQNDRVVIHYSPSLFPYVKFLHYMNIEDAAVLSLEKKKKNGDISYRLRVANDNPSFLNREILITLFNHTNKCYVNMGNTSGFAFTGYVFKSK